jgi:hypothetical protein
MKKVGFFQFVDHSSNFSSEPHSSLGLRWREAQKNGVTLQRELEPTILTTSFLLTRARSTGKQHTGKGLGNTWAESFS